MEVYDIPWSIGYFGILYPISINGPCAYLPDVGFPEILIRTPQSSVTEKFASSFPTWQNN